MLFGDIMGDVELSTEELKILTVCYQKPGNSEKIAEELHMELTVVDTTLQTLSEQGLVEENNGEWKTTSDGDLIIESSN
jgi:predicted transcriptional regulator